MKQIRHLKANVSSRGFTLIEILIVGLLIALFAGIGIFGVQQAFLENQRKAVIGEVRQIAASLGFAKQDIDFYPKLCFMNMSLKNLYANVYMLNHVHYMGFESNQLASRASIDWAGAYFASSQTRAGISQGRKGGIVKMICPDVVPVANTNSLPPAYDWPADTYGNPYVLYLVKNQYDSGTGTYAPVFITDPWEDADKLNAVVSYGRNRIPGGGFDQTTKPPQNLEARLYTDGPNPQTFYNLSVSITVDTMNFYYNQNIRAKAISNKYYPGAINTDIWITDPGSDDVIYEF